MAMNVITDWQDLTAGNRGAAAALGNFDGVHLGHREVIAQAAQAARALDAPLAVITFDPHPRRVFRPADPPFRLTTLAQQSRALEALGVQRLYLLHFDFAMAQMSDRQFAQAVLHEGLGVRHVAVGFDISFGAGRTGSPASMKAYGEGFGFGVSVTPALTMAGGTKVSSSAVREALRDGAPEQAADMLGWPFSIEGVVRRGRQLGRQLGYPTANVALEDYVAPRLGIYATRTRMADGRILPGVSNIGRNPTVGEVEARLETHLFDFDEDIYGEVIETFLIAFLRPEEKFDGLAPLIEQMGRDCIEARRILGIGPAI
jgi:riboflavin kinase/FMN adenylyltransferase